MLKEVRAWQKKFAPARYFPESENAMQGIKDRFAHSAWGARLSFAAVLLVCSEWIVWQKPTAYHPLEWLGIATVYVALAALTLDLLVRLNVREAPRLLVLAGLYGLVNATLIAHITARDLPVSLLGRPLGAQPLAFLLALAIFQVLSSGRPTGPLDFVGALGSGVLWGIWVRWFPTVSDEPAPAASSDQAIIALALLLLGCAALRFLLPGDSPRQERDWSLSYREMALMGAVLIAALAVGLGQGAIAGADLVILIGLGGFLAIILWLSALPGGRPSVLRHMLPLRRPNMAGWLLVVVAFLIGGWIGHHLPGEAQSDALFGALAVFGLVWPPVTAGLIGARVLARLTHEGW